MLGCSMIQEKVQGAVKRKTDDKKVSKIGINHIMG